MPSLDKPGGALTTTVKWRFPSTHPEGRKFGIIVAVLCLIAAFLAWETIAWPLALLTICFVAVLNFFLFRVLPGVAGLPVREFGG